MIVNTICYADLRHIFDEENLIKILNSLSEYIVFGDCDVECLRVGKIISEVKELGLILSQKELERIEAIQKLNIEYINIA